MTNSKNTKRALLASILSMLVCAAMLIGSTFAWFTDSVTSGNNKIVAGNLDVKLEYSTNLENWREVDKNTNVFKAGALWEPGYTEVVYLRVSNAGSLALKYRFAVNVADKVIGQTADGEEIDLSDFIEFGVAPAPDAAYPSDEAGRAAAVAAVAADAKPISAGYSKEGAMAKGAEPEVLAMVVYMPEDVGNGANHGAGKPVPSISLGVSLVAAQDTVEEDSFGSDYDADAWGELEKQQRLEDLIAEGYTPVDSNSAFTEATANNDKIVVSEDLVVDQQTPIVKGSTTVDFNYGKVTRATRNGSGLKVQNYAADVTLQNANFVSTQGGTVVRVEGAKSLTIKNSSFVNEAEGSTGSQLFQLYPMEDGEKMVVTFENCVFDTGYITFSGYDHIAEYEARFVNCKFIWDDINGSSFVQADSRAKGNYSFESCTFEYTNWWSGDLIKIDNYKEKSTATLKDITVTGSGDKKPYVISGFSVGGKKNLTVTIEGTNSYTYNSETVDWNTIAVDE